MTFKNTKQLRNLETLYRRIEAVAPANDVEKRTRRLLLELAQAQRAELRRKLVRPHIKIRRKRAA